MPDCKKERFYQRYPKSVIDEHGEEYCKKVFRDGLRNNGFVVDSETKIVKSKELENHITLTARAVKI